MKLFRIFIFISWFTISSSFAHADIEETQRKFLLSGNIAEKKQAIINLCNLRNGELIFEMLDLLKDNISIDIHLGVLKGVEYYFLNRIIDTKRAFQSSDIDAAIQNKFIKNLRTREQEVIDHILQLFPDLRGHAKDTAVVILSSLKYDKAFPLYKKMMLERGEKRITLILLNNLLDMGFYDAELIEAGFQAAFDKNPDAPQLDTDSVLMRAHGEEVLEYTESKESIKRNKRYFLELLFKVPVSLAENYLFTILNREKNDSDFTDLVRTILRKIGGEASARILRNLASRQDQRGVETGFAKEHLAYMLLDDTLGSDLGSNLLKVLSGEAGDKQEKTVELLFSDTFMEDLEGPYRRAVTQGKVFEHRELNLAIADIILFYGDARFESIFLRKPTELLVEPWGNNYPKVQREAIRICGRFGKGRHAHLIAPFLRSEHRFLREEAALALERIRSFEVFETAFANTLVGRFSQKELEKRFQFLASLMSGVQGGLTDQDPEYLKIIEVFQSGVLETQTSIEFQNFLRRSGDTFSPLLAMHYESFSPEVKLKALEIFANSTKTEGHRILESEAKNPGFEFSFEAQKLYRQLLFFEGKAVFGSVDSETEFYGWMNLKKHTGLQAWQQKQKDPRTSEWRNFLVEVRQTPYERFMSFEECLAASFQLKEEKAVFDLRIAENQEFYQEWIKAYGESHPEEKKALDLAQLDSTKGEISFKNIHPQFCAEFNVGVIVSLNGEAHVLHDAILLSTLSLNHSEKMKVLRQEVIAEVQAEKNHTEKKTNHLDKIYENWPGSHRFQFIRTLLVVTYFSRFYAGEREAVTEFASLIDEGYIDNSIILFIEERRAELKLLVGGSEWKSVIDSLKMERAVLAAQQMLEKLHSGTEFERKRRGEEGERRGSQRGTFRRFRR